MSMDELAAQLGDAFRVEEGEGITTAGAHPRFAMYKSRGYVAGSQDKRRSEYLENQKKRRSDAIMKTRNLAHEVDEDDTDAEAMEQEKSRKGAAGRRTRKNFYKDRLMLSEWLVDVPSDLAENWICVPCPEGKRLLVVAAKGRTRAYRRGGSLFAEFVSLLPGGSPHSHSSKQYAILDCVYSEIDDSFYVLDLLCWCSDAYIECEYEFRSFWITSKFVEAPDLAERSAANEKPFIALQGVVAEKDSLEKLMIGDFGFKRTGLDGLLFYHKLCHYVAGSSPLVGWLKAFMLPEILSVPVPPRFLSGHEGTTAEGYIQAFDEEYHAENKHGVDGYSKAEKRVEMQDA